jgi:hypothetical protein
MDVWAAQELPMGYRNQFAAIPVWPRCTGSGLIILCQIQRANRP